MYYTHKPVLSLKWDRPLHKKDINNVFCVMHTYIHKHVHMRIHIHIHIHTPYKHTHTYTYIYTYTYTYTYTNTYICIYIHEISLLKRRNTLGVLIVEVIDRLIVV